MHEKKTETNLFKKVIEKSEPAVNLKTKTQKMDTKKLTAVSSQNSQSYGVMNMFDDLDKKELTGEVTEGDYAAFADEVTKWLSEIEMSDENNDKNQKSEDLKDQPMSEDIDY